MVSATDSGLSWVAGCPVPVFLRLTLGFGFGEEADVEEVAIGGRIFLVRWPLHPGNR